MLMAQTSLAQCPGGYSQAQVNWDHLDYYWNSGSGNGPYEAYISDVREMTQKFAIGKTWLSIATSSAAMVNPGTGNYARNGTHTGDIANFTGEDLQFNPSADGQTITITFGASVQNVSFTLYDIDASARVDIDAYNSGNVAQNVDITTYASSTLSITNDNSINTYVTSGTGSDHGNSSNQGTATATISSLITKIVITVTTRGSNAVFWLSDINACVPGSFPINYHQTATPDLQPFTGPVANQPSYILATPDNDGVYMVDPATGQAKYLFQDNSKDYTNSFAYDPVHRFLYYISENPSANASNKELKKYDFNTGTSSTVVADISAALGIPTFGSGIESAGAAWYDGALYLGIEGGKSTVGTAKTRRSIIWRIDFNASQTPVNAYQVYATDAYDPSNTGSSIHDWGDFLVKDGVIIDFNTARNGSNYSKSKYQHYNMMTGVETLYTNPSTSQFAGQGGLAWDGTLYWLRDSVGKYNGDGSNDYTTSKKLVVVNGPNGIGPYATWEGGTGDASDPFRPKSDFGDAPASYDPDPQAPATHEIIPELHLGATVTDEWVHTASALADAEPSTEENGVVGGVSPLPMDATLTYSVTVRVFNNTGGNATLAGWLDWDFDGVFDPGEGVTATVTPSATAKDVVLTWSNIWVQVTTNTHTFLRLRVTRSVNGMTAANGMNGWFPDGEVEDWPVLMGAALPKDIEQFTLGKKSNSVDVQWSLNVQQAVKNFEILRSADNTNWQTVATVNAKEGFGLQQYVYNDKDPFPGKSYYRIGINYVANGANKVTEVRSVRFENSSPILKVLPNPAVNYAELQLTAAVRGKATIEVFDQSGKKLFSQQKTIEAGLNRLTLDNIHSFTAGMYLVRVNLDGRIMNTKLIISKH
jgi:hypothetical protein